MELPQLHPVSGIPHTDTTNYGGQGKLSRYYLWIWLGILLLVVLPCTVVSIISMVDFFGVKSTLEQIKGDLEEHKSKPFFELHGIRIESTVAKPKSDGVCEIKKEDELNLLRFDKNNFVTNKIYKTFDLKDTKFAVPVTGIYELQLRAVRDNNNNSCASTLMVSKKEIKFPCRGKSDSKGPSRGNIVMWQTLQYIEKTDDVSVKVEAEKDVFRCTDSQPLSIIGEMKAKEEEL